MWVVSAFILMRRGRAAYSTFHRRQLGAACVLTGSPFELLGHADLATTQIYVATDPRRRAEAIARLPDFDVR